MDRLQELLGRIQELSDEELFELRDIITAQFDAMQADATAVHGEASLEQLESLAAAATAVNRQRERRYQNVTRDHDARQVLASFRTDGRHPTVPADRRPRHVASGGVRPTAVTAAGIPIGDRNDLAARLVEAINGRQAPNSGDGRVRVGTIRSRTAREELPPSDAETATAAITAAAEAHDDASSRSRVSRRPRAAAARPARWANE